MKKGISRIALSLLSAGIMMSFVGEAAARNLSYSAGHGVKCYYVLVSSINSVNTYQTICRKGV